MGLIYFADDDLDARSLVKGCPTVDGHTVECFEPGRDLLHAFLREPCDLVVLDVMMPGVDGMEILKRLRTISSVPVIMLTAKAGEEDCFSGFSTGADDYMTKPFRPILLRGKVHALLSRAQLDARKAADGEPLPDLRCGNLHSANGGQSFQVGAKILDLTPLERQYLYFMMERFNKPVSRAEALQEVWNLPDSNSRVVDETNRRVRIKLTEAHASVTLESVWGVGYILKEISTAR